MAQKFLNGIVSIGDVTVDSEHLILKGSSPEFYFHTTGNHVNWLIAAQESTNATLEFGAVTASTSLDTDASQYTPVLKLAQSGGATFAGTVTAPQVSLSTTSTTDPVLRLIDAGVIAYDWSFPDTGTIKLGVSATSTKTLKLINAGSGSFNIEASNLSGTNTGDQTLPTDFVSKANGGQFDGFITIKEDTDTGTTTGKSFLTLHNDNSDISQQQSFIDFKFTDTNANHTPQVRIGAQVGPDADANAISKEGAGSFVVYTAPVGNDELGGSAGLTERFRVGYNGTSRFTGILHASQHFVTPLIYSGGGSVTFGNDVDLTRSSTGQIISRVWNSNTSGTGTSVMRIANSGGQANGARLEFSDQNYYNATVSVDRTNGMRFMVHDNSTNMADLLTHTVLTLGTDKTATFASGVNGSYFTSTVNAATGGFEGSRDYLIAGTGSRGGGLVINDISGARNVVMI